MTRKTCSKTALALCGAVATTALSGPAYAQADTNATTEDEIVVTGSLLRRPVSQQSQLITTLDAEQLERNGAGSAVEALETIGQNQPTTVSATSSGSGTGFATFANLRSLGDSSTLVLFNGRRVATSPLNYTGVDLNTLPIAAVNRVETLADGASSVYGSDAVAGVINYITPLEYQGLTISGGAFQPEAGGGAERYTGSIMGGIGDLDEDHWNIYAAYAGHHRNALEMASRDFAASSYYPQFGVDRTQNRPPLVANWSKSGFLGGQRFNPQAPDCLPPSEPYYDGVQGANACAFNLQTFSQARPEEENESLYLRGARQINEHHTATLEYFRSRVDVLSTINPNGFNGRTLSQDSEYYPGAPGYIANLPAGVDSATYPCWPATSCPTGNIQIFWRPLVFGRIESEELTDSDRLTLDLAGDVVGWDYDLWAMRATADMESIVGDGNLALGPGSAARTALLGDGPGGVPDLNPWGEQSPEALAFIEDQQRAGAIDISSTVLESGGAQISRDLFQLPAGAIQLALAVDYKSETNRFRFTDLDIELFGDDPVDYNFTRESYGAVIEARVPITQTVSADLSVRYDDYSDFGETTNPKILLSWDPSNSVSFRASYNEGFRAPTLQQLNLPFDATLVSFLRLPDPVLCPGNVPGPFAEPSDCQGSDSLYTLGDGGNAALGPERSAAYTIGATLRPTPNITIAVDYWNYEISDAVGRVSESAIMSNPGVYGALIHRCSEFSGAELEDFAACDSTSLYQTAFDPNRDPIAFVDVSAQNSGAVSTDGIDFTLGRIGPDLLGGQTSVNYRGTAVLSYDYQNSPTDPVLSRLGRYRDGYPVFEYIHQIYFNWERGPLTLQLAHSYKSGYRDANEEGGPGAFLGLDHPELYRDVSSYSLWNLVGAVRATEHATITGRISNLFDTDPPFSNTITQLGAGWDARFTDPVGRAYSITARFEL